MIRIQVGELGHAYKTYNVRVEEASPTVEELRVAIERLTEILERTQSGEELRRRITTSWRST